MAARTNTKRVTPQIKPRDLLTFHQRLAHWYKTHGRRDLPWRNTTDPYHIWVSEVMLQQTQVATVLNKYYFPFLQKFPTIAHLATAPKQKVLKAWEGLGYYRRAGFLHEAAKMVTSHQSPVFSKMESSLATGDWRLATYNALRALPGIGRNTAHAILAFAHHQPVPVLEANVKRVVARIFAQENDNDLWREAESLLNRKAPFDYNQAMMDVGALLCTPKTPSCGKCPANAICKGKASPESYPARKAKKAVPTKHVTIAVMEDAAGKLFLEARKDALLGGLYGFPQISLSRYPMRGEAEAQDLRKRWRVSQDDGKQIGTVTHTYSHFKLEGDVYHVQLNRIQNSPNWHTRAEISNLPLSRLDHKVLALVDNRHSTVKSRAKPKRTRHAA